MAGDLRALLEEAELPLPEVAAIGVSVPGPLDPSASRVIAPPNLPGWDDVPVRDLLADALHNTSVYLENDANAAALAEWRFGAGRGRQCLVYLTMSTGVGAGLILDGRLRRGRSGNAGEVGHTVIEWDGELCGCGMRGCLEAYIGGANWARRLAAITPATSAVASLAGGRAHATPVHVVQAARQGDAFALAEMERFNDYLARAIVNLGFVLDVEAVILGTIAVAAGDALCFEPLRRRVGARLWPRIAAGLEILPAALGERLPDYAGLCVAIDGLEADEAR